MTTDNRPTIDVSDARPDTASDYTCPACGRAWDGGDAWAEDEARSEGGRSGGVTYYECPTDDCEGLAVIHW